MKTVIEMPPGLDLPSYAAAKLDLDYVPSITDVLVELQNRGYDVPNDDSPHNTVKFMYAALRYL
jgi:cobalamin biosynthesis Mg chelatase CobN